MSVLALALGGLSLASLLGLGGLLGAVVTGLYLLRVRRRTLTVPFVGLWQRVTGPEKAHVFRSRLTRFGSLLLQLLLLALLLLALSDPRLEEEEEGRSIVLLVDVSASMSVVEDGRSRFERAQEAGRAWARGLGAEDRLLLVALGARPEPRGGFTADKAELEARLGALQVLDTEADLRAALELSREVLAGRPRPEIVLLSDGALDLESARAVDLAGVRLSLGSALAPGALPPSELDNVAVSAFSARRYPGDLGRFEVLAELSNEGRREIEVELVLSEVGPALAAPRPLEVRRLTLPPEGARELTFADVSGARGALEARVTRLDGRVDGLPRDDVAFALLPERRRVRALLVGPANHFLEAALLVDETIEPTRVEESAYPPPGDFDLVIFDGVSPQRVARSGPALYLGAPSPGISAHPLTSKKKLEGFGFDHWDKKHPIFRFVDPYDVQVLAGAALQLGPGDRELARSDAGLIFVEGERPEGRFLALGFDPRQSDFVLRAEFPLFLGNVVDYLARAEGGEVLGSSWTTGEVWRFPVPGLERGRATLVGPLGRGGVTATVPVEEGRGVFFGERAGLYEVRSDAGAALVAASMTQSAESRLLPRRELALAERSFESVAPPEERRSFVPWIALALGALALSLFEWFSYHRRWTV